MKSLNPVSLDRTDGIRLVFEDGWVLIRASNTSPIIRLTAEAKDQDRMNELIEEFSVYLA